MAEGMLLLSLLLLLSKSNTLFSTMNKPKTYQEKRKEEIEKNIYKGNGTKPNIPNLPNLK